MSLQLDDELSCSICLELYRSPLTLPCLHSFCAECLRELAQGSNGPTLSCPQCRANIQIPGGGVANFPKNFNLESIIGESRRCLRTIVFRRLQVLDIVFPHPRGFTTVTMAPGGHTITLRGVTGSHFTHPTDRDRDTHTVLPRGIIMATPIILHPGTTREDHRHN
uniref:Tripartite motif-containing protein 59 n=1 Tax=Magallana gigas TaxID=29159 RepID=K1R320_MAGGI